MSKKLFFIVTVILLLLFSKEHIVFSETKDDLREMVHAASTGYDLYKAAIKFEQAINNYKPNENPEDINPLAASIVRSTYDNLVNCFYASNQSIVEFASKMAFKAGQAVIQANEGYLQAQAAYEQALQQKELAETYGNVAGAAAASAAAFEYTSLAAQAHFMAGIYSQAQQSSSFLAESIQRKLADLALLHSISIGAASAGLSSGNSSDYIANLVSISGAKAFASGIASDLAKKQLPEAIYLQIYAICEQLAKETIYSRIKSWYPTTAINSDACMKTSDVVGQLGIAVAGALFISQEGDLETMPQRFQSSLDLLINDPLLNPLPFNTQQTIYAETYAPIFAASFSGLINSAAADVINTSSDSLIIGAKEIASGVAAMILTTKQNPKIEDAYSYALVLNSDLLTSHDVNRNQKIDMPDIVHQLGIISRIKLK